MSSEGRDAGAAGEGAAVPEAWEIGADAEAGAGGGTGGEEPWGWLQFGRSPIEGEVGGVSVGTRREVELGDEG